MEGQPIAQLLYGILGTIVGILAWRTRGSYFFPNKVIGNAINVLVLLLGPSVVVLAILEIASQPHS